MVRTKFSEHRHNVVAKPGPVEWLAELPAGST
jgi:hypothetical protein